METIWEDDLTAFLHNLNVRRHQNIQSSPPKLTSRNINTHFLPAGLLSLIVEDVEEGYFEHQDCVN